MILLGCGALVSLVIYGLYFGLRCLIRQRKKKTILPDRWWFEDSIDFAINLAFVLIFALILVLAFGGTTFWNSIFYFATLSVICLFIQPLKFFNLIKSKLLFANENKRKSVLSITLLTFVLLETFAFNARAYSTNQAATDVLMSDSSIDVGDGTLNDDGTVTYSENEYFIITPSDTSATRMCLDFSSTVSEEVTVKIYSSTDTLLIRELDEYICNPVVTDANLIKLSDLSKYGSLKVIFSFNWAALGYGDNVGKAQTVSIKGVILNAPILFYYSPLRFIGVSILAAAIIYLSYFVEKVEGKVKDISRKWELGILIGGAAVFLGFLTYAIINSGSYFFSYPLKNSVEEYDIYTQMFDAFRKGQFNLDVAVGNGIAKLWDHAYYNGNCYSYYGVLPVFLVSFPLYFLTGMVPQVVLLETLGAILEVQVMLILIVEICKVFFKKLNNWTLAFILFVCFFTTLSVGFVTYKSYFIGDVITDPCVEGIYHIPVIYGLLSLDLFILMVLFAYQSKKFRMLFLAFSGLAFVFIMSTRPDLFLGLIFVIPLLIKMLLDKSDKVWHRLLNFVPMVVILFLGGALIAGYNYVRFGSIFEYGQRYQNTISDQSSLSILPDQILPGLFHYFLNPWTFNSTTYFPFIGVTNPRITSDSQDFSFYLNSYSGVFSIPFFLLILSLPFSLKKGEDRWLNAFAVLIPVAMAALAVVTYSFAGLCPRYMFEMYNLATLASVISLFKFLERKPQSKGAFIPIIFAMVLASIFICWNLANTSFFGMNGGDLNGIVLRIREAFGYFNV